MCVNRLRPCLHKSVLIDLTCSAHSGRGLSTQMISFLQCGGQKKGKSSRERCGKLKDKKKQTEKMDKMLKFFAAKHNGTPDTNKAHDAQ